MAMNERVHGGTVAYPGVQEPLRIPRTPLESRQGAHPKKDYLVWKTPPSRQLTREKRVEYQSDVRERFYDDYIGQRATGDARNEVLTGVHKLGFDPAIYRANALQGLAYDPARQVPVGVDFNAALRVERNRDRQREVQRFRQRRLSDSQLLAQPASEYRPYLEPIEAQKQLTGPPGPTISSGERPRSALQKSLDETLHPEIVPAVEDWLTSATKQDKEVAAKFFRQVTSQGKRPDPASKASLHSTRVRSAVMTPTRRQREQKMTQNYFEQLSRDTTYMGATVQPQPMQPQYPRRPIRRSLSEKVTSKGSMFTAKKQQPAHYTVHPDWASETINPSKRK